jgi:phenylacetyl-CoA:acceptor oxidoreductase subunit 1
MARWGMVIDLRKCIGCGACRQVCGEANKVLPGMRWRQVFEGTAEKGSDGKRLFLTIGCMHCNNPPCLDVCPSKATYHRPDGIVDIDYGRCVGCGYCIVACPYKVRSLATSDIISLDDGDSAEKSDMKPDRIGVCTKCNFCLPRLDAGLAQGLKPGIDPEATPACVNICVAEALHFGDLDDPKSVVSQMISENKIIRLGEDLCTEPSVYYIYN